MKLIALKSMSYATRRMEAGEPFDAKDRDGKILIKIGKARDANFREPVSLPPPPPGLAERIVSPEPGKAGEEPALEQAEDDVEHQKEQLRHEAEALNIAVDGRWGVARLQEEIEAARGKAG